MARKLTPAPVAPQSALNEAVVQEGVTALNALAVLQTERRQGVQDMAARMGYDGPLTPDAVENCISLYRQRSAEAVLGLGKALLLLKEMVPHGEFMERLHRQSFEDRMARRLMAVASKFGKTDNLSILKAAGNQAKLLELTVLEDGEIAALEAGGTVRGIDLDDVQRMGFAELRLNLREARQDKAASEKLLAEKNAKIDKLSRRIARTKPDDVLLELQKEATAFMSDAMGCIKGQLRQACIAIKNHGDGDTDNSRFMAGLLGQLQADLTALRQEFDLPDVSNARDQELLAEQAQWAGKD